VPSGWGFRSEMPSAASAAASVSPMTTDCSAAARQRRLERRHAALLRLLRRLVERASLRARQLLLRAGRELLRQQVREDAPGQRREVLDDDLVVDVGAGDVPPAMRQEDDAHAAPLAQRGVGLALRDDAAALLDRSRDPQMEVDPRREQAEGLDAEPERDEGDVVLLQPRHEAEGAARERPAHAGVIACAAHGAHDLRVGAGGERDDLPLSGGVLGDDLGADPDGAGDLREGVPGRRRGLLVDEDRAAGAGQQERREAAR
jgi:hypothetical protein